MPIGAEIWVPAVAGILSSVLQNASNRDLQQGQENYNKQMLQQQNAYNDPSAQMQRLKAAGINPIAGTMSNGSSIMANQSAVPLPKSLIPNADIFSAAAGSLSSIGSAFSAWQSGEDLRSTRDVRMKEIQARTDQLIADAELLKTNSAGQQIVNSYIAAEKEQGLREGRSRIWKNYVDSAKAIQEVRNLRYTLEKIWPQELINLVDEHEINILRLEEVSALIADYWSQINLNSAKQVLTEEQTRTQEQITKREGAEADTSEVESANAEQYWTDYLESIKAMTENYRSGTSRNYSDMTIGQLLKAFGIVAAFVFTKGKGGAKAAKQVVKSAGGTPPVPFN